MLLSNPSFEEKRPIYLQTSDWGGHLNHWGGLDDFTPGLKLFPQLSTEWLFPLEYPVISACNWLPFPQRPVQAIAFMSKSSWMTFSRKNLWSAAKRFTANFVLWFLKTMNDQFYLVCSLHCTINPWCFIDHGSTIKHITQDPLEIFWSFLQTSMVFESSLKCLQIIFCTSFILGFLSKIYRMGTKRLDHLIVPFGIFFSEQL